MRTFAATFLVLASRTGGAAHDRARAADHSVQDILDMARIDARRPHRNGSGHRGRLSACACSREACVAGHHCSSRPTPRLRSDRPAPTRSPWHPSSRQWPIYAPVDRRFGARSSDRGWSAHLGDRSGTRLDRASSSIGSRASTGDAGSTATFGTVLGLSITRGLLSARRCIWPRIPRRRAMFALAVRDLYARHVRLVVMASASSSSTTNRTSSARSARCCG